MNKYGAEAAFIPTALLKICNKTLADYPQPVGAGTSIPTTCDRAITQKETIYGVAGHMHLRGHDISVVLDPGTPKAADAAAHPGVGLPLAGRLLPRRPRSRSARATRSACAARSTTRRPTSR